MPFGFLRDGPGQPGPVHRFNHVKEVNGLADFVRLQRADQMQLDAGVAAAQFRPLAHGFLDPVLAKHGQPQIDCLLNAMGFDRL